MQSALLTDRELSELPQTLRGVEDNATGAEFPVRISDRLRALTADFDAQAV